MKDRETCAVAGCTNTSSTDNPNAIKFYAFSSPSSTSKDVYSQVQRNKWIEFVRVSRGLDPLDQTWTPDEDARICSAHFLRNQKSDNPVKVNFGPTIYPDSLEDKPPQITYDLNDLVCWWIKNANNHPDLTPVVESQPTAPREAIQSFTLVNIRVSPHPTIHAFIKVKKDLSFESSLDSTPIPPSTLLGDNESTPLLGSVLEFKSAVEKLSTLRLCEGTSAPTAALPPGFHASIKKTKGEPRLVSTFCAKVIDLGNTCKPCRNAWIQLNRFEKRNAVKRPPETNKVDEEARKKVKVEPTEQDKPVNPPKPAPQKVLKITKEEAELLRQLTSASSTGNVVRVNATHLAQVKQILQSRRNAAADQTKKSSDNQK